MKLKLLSSFILISLCFIFLDLPLQVESSQVVFDRKGRVLDMALTSTDKFRFTRNLDELNPEFIKLMLHKEDQMFFYHMGVNPFTFIKASFHYFFGKEKGGASTITMQLARLYYDLETTSIMGKLYQIVAATWLEFIHSKKTLLEAYLNLIPMGKNIEGFESAALYYFSKNGMELNPYELKLLSLLPQRPSFIGPRIFTKKNTHSLDLKKIFPNLNDDEAINYLNAMNIHQKRPFHAPHYINFVRSFAKENAVYTSLDLKTQNEIQEILKHYIDGQKARGIKNATTLVIDSDNNDIVSYIGSADFFNNAIHGQVDGIQAKRSPGSTLKPFIYAKAFEEGMLFSKSIVFDSPLSYRTPENYDRSFKGPMTVHDALITSRNIPAVYINNELQRKRKGLYSLANSLYPDPHKRGYYGSSIALGALEVNSIQLGELYSALANNGEFRRLNYLRSHKKMNPFPILSQASSVMVKKILKNNPRPNLGESEKYTHSVGDVYWKTGTSFGFRDAWAVGIWQKYVIVTWVGDFSSKSNPFLVGSISAAPLFFKIVDYLRSNYSILSNYDLKHQYSDNVKEVEVCTISGHIPNKNCSVTHKTDYIPGVSSIEKCKIHQNIALSKKNHLRVCPKYQGQTYNKVFELFSSAKADIYTSAGVQLKQPPKFEKICRGEVSTDKKGVDPVIISPKIGFTYIASTKGKKALIPLEARVDSATKVLSWYLNGKLYKKTKNSLNSSIELKPGNYNLKIVDDLGRVANRLVKVREI